MSLITTCPSCSTRFRVVADQLRISDGWVRCGQCQEVFDARNHLNAPPPPPPPPPASVAAPAAVSPSAPVGTQAAVPPTQVAAPPQAPAPSATPSANRAGQSASAPVFNAASPSATAAQQTTASTSGYELPAPQWSDDIDFSDYQAEPTAAEVPVSVAPSTMPSPVVRTAQVPVSPAFMDSVSARPPEAKNAATAAPQNEEPAWSAAARAPAVAKDAFPPLDSSLLEARRTPPVPPESAGKVAEESDQIGHSRNVGEHGRLSNNEQLKPAGGEAGGASVFGALDSHLQGNLRNPTAHRIDDLGSALQQPAVDAGPTTLPRDEIETIAQKLAQTQPDLASTATQADAHSGFAGGAWSDEASEALDSSLEPSFVREARRKAWWQKPMVRVAMGAGVVVLPVALALQVALHERNALASWQPSARPALEFMCTALQCKLAPRQQIRAMVVTGSSFTQGDAERSYQLSLSIQNQASTPVGVPALELTLTDSQDQAIARKVILAKDLGAPAELVAGSEWSGTVPITTEGLNLQVAGYRVLLFYP